MNKRALAFFFSSFRQVHLFFFARAFRQVFRVDLTDRGPLDCWIGSSYWLQLQYFGALSMARCGRKAILGGLRVLGLEGLAVRWVVRSVREPADGPGLTELIVPP